MKNTVFTCALVLGSSMFLAAQQAPAASTPPTFPQDQQQSQTAPRPDQPAASQSQLPPDTQAPASTQAPAADAQVPATDTAAQSGTTTATSSSSTEKKTIEGCLSQNSADNSFMLADASGMSYKLQGSSSDLTPMVGQQIRVKGTLNSSSTSVSTSTPADSTQSSAPASSVSIINVDSVKKIAASCSTATK